VFFGNIKEISVEDKIFYRYLSAENKRISGLLERGGGGL